MKSASNDRPPRGGATPNWDANDSAQLYGINSWGAGYFNVSDAGEVQVNVDFEGNPVAVSLMEIVRGTGLSALIATHNPELAARMDRILRLDAGRIVTA